MKQGRLSKQEISFINQNSDLSPEEIAEQLDRNPSSIKKFITKRGTPKELTASYDLTQRPFWEEIQQQFDKAEQKMFQYHWKRIIGQFRDDVLPTEELQIVDAIKLEILMNRALRSQRSTMEDIEDMESTLIAEKNKPLEDQLVDNIFNLERQIAILRAAQESLSKDYKDLQGKKSSMLKDMKATREQRIRRLEDSKQTFVGWIKALSSDQDFRDELSINMEKMRLAMNKEYERLSGYHKYDDGTIDQPLLTPENVRND